MRTERCSHLKGQRQPHDSDLFSGTVFRLQPMHRHPRRSSSPTSLWRSSLFVEIIRRLGTTTCRASDLPISCNSSVNAQWPQRPSSRKNAGKAVSLFLGKAAHVRLKRPDYWRGRSVEDAQIPIDQGFHGDSLVLVFEVEPGTDTSRLVPMPGDPPCE